MSSELVPVRPGYLAEMSQYDNSDLQRYSKPPRIKIVQALTGQPFKPSFKDGDIVLVPKMVKIGGVDDPFDFIVVHFFPTWICLNPIQMRGQLKSIRDFSMDPESTLAKKCKAFVKEKCPENPEFYLSHAQTLNFMVVVEEVAEVDDTPVHLFFSRGSYVDGQALIAELEKRKAHRCACRFRAASFLHQGQKGIWYRLALANASEMWVQDRERFLKYKQYHEEIKKLVDDRTMEFDLDDVTDPEQQTEF